MNNLCHLEIQVRDFEKSQAFYGELFGWTFRSFGPDMVIFGNGDEHIGGFMKGEPNDTRAITLWFKVKSLSEMQAKCRELGGRADDEISPVPGVGHSTSLYDLDGNHIGIVQYDE